MGITKRSKFVLSLAIVGILLVGIGAIILGLGPLGRVKDYLASKIRPLSDRGAMVVVKKEIPQKLTRAVFDLAKQDNNLYFDFDKDGKVTDKDIAAYTKETGRAITDITAAAEVTEESSDSEEFTLPSVSGFSSSAFTGSATVNYPIS